MSKQKIKIKFDNNEIFFFDHGFKSAWGWAEKFIEGNTGKFKMEIFILNESSSGKRYIKIKEVRA